MMARRVRDAEGRRPSKRVYAPRGIGGRNLGTADEYWQADLHYVDGLHDDAGSVWFRTHEDAAEFVRQCGSRKS